MYRSHYTSLMIQAKIGTSLVDGHRRLRNFSLRHPVAGEHETVSYQTNPKCVNWSHGSYVLWYLNLPG